ncbi:MAG: type II toxin-antitoxin system VapC family toxin [Candidatus Sumerlaeota bacterium]|nr:type II toxin-antitoxin system VapC family toxin [Candidatus Sumerlaeota bacterium]
MIFDTDILIWIRRGNREAAQLVEDEDECLLSVLTYMELLQGASDKRHISDVRDFLAENAFRTLPLTENIGHRAAVYIEQYALSHGLRANDAIIAATAVEHGLTLCTANAKHFKPIKELKLRHFKL